MPEAPSLVVTLPGYPFTNLASAETLAALRALSSTAFTNGQDILVDASATAGDGLGGIYSWNSASLAADNGRSIIKPTDKASLQAGRWLLSSNPASAVVSISDFGASTATADNTSAINAAIDAVFAAGGGTVMVPVGQFNYATAIIQKAGVRIVGQGYGSRLHSTNTTRLHGISATGASTGSRISGLAIENLRLTSTFTNSAESTGNAIKWKWVKDSFISNVWADHWSDSGVSITDSDRVHGSSINISFVSQGYDVFNDSTGCTVNGLIVKDVKTFVGLNVEGLAAGSTDKPTNFIGTNIHVDGAKSYGINLVSAVRPVVSGWSACNTVGTVTENGDGFNAYGCTNANIGPGTAQGNAGYGLWIGPTSNDTNVVGVVTSGNADGSCLVTDLGGVGNAFRVGMMGCKFLEGDPTLSGGVSIENKLPGPVVLYSSEAGALSLRSKSVTKRNLQVLFLNNISTDAWRLGVDVSTDNGSTQFELYRDGVGTALSVTAAGAVNALASYSVAGTKVLGARDTGWTAMTGTGSKGALAAAAAGTASAGYVQAELQTALNRIAALEARMKSLDAALVAHGVIGA